MSTLEITIKVTATNMEATEAAKVIMIVEEARKALARATAKAEVSMTVKASVK